MADQSAPKYNIEKILEEGLNTEYKITVDGDVFTSLVNQEIKAMGARAKLPGFRPGKGPRTILEGACREDAIKRTVENQIYEIYKHVKTTIGFNEPLSNSFIVQNIPIDESNADFVFVIKLVSKPEIPSIDPSLFSLAEYNVEIDENELLENYKKSRNQGSLPIPLENRFADSEEGYQAQVGDRVEFKCTIKMCGKTIGEIKSEGVTLGQNLFNGNFDNFLVGAKAGNNLAFSCIISDPAIISEKKKSCLGKMADFSVTILKIMKVVDCTNLTDEEFAKICRFDSFEDFIKQYKVNLQEKADSMKRGLLKNELFKKLDEAYQFEIPKELIEKEKMERQSLLENNKNPNKEELSSEEQAANDEELTKDSVSSLKLGALIFKYYEDHKNELDVSRREFIENTKLNFKKAFGFVPYRIEEMIYSSNAQSSKMYASFFEEKILESIHSKITKVSETISFQELNDKFKKMTAE